MAAKLLLLVAACAFGPSLATEQTSQWRSLMTASKAVQTPAHAASLEETALEEAALQDAEKEIGALDDTTPKAKH